jgi:hypothetical protein
MSDGDLPDVYEETHPEARKKHKCCECGRVINKGEKYQKVKGCWYGEWSTYQTCEECEKDWDVVINFFGCCRVFGELSEYKHQI